jgi:hypothetical protein
VQPAVNGVIVGGDFDQRLLVRVDKSDITRRGFDQQVIVHWHNLHQLAVGRDHPPMVVTLMFLTIPRTGDLTVRRVTESWRP